MLSPRMLSYPYLSSATLNMVEKTEKEGTEKKGRGSGKHICERGSTRCLDRLLAVFTQDSHSEAACLPGDDYAEHLAAKSWEVKMEKASWGHQTRLHSLWKHLLLLCLHLGF